VRNGINMKTFEEISNIAEELRRYAELDGTEVGQACNLICTLATSYGDYIGDEFKEAVYKEIETQLNFFKKNCKIVSETIPVQRTVYDLEWNDDIVYGDEEDNELEQLDMFDGE